MSEIVIKKVSDKDYSYANILVFGEAGAGKTFLASTYDSEKILYLNVVSESGLMTLRSQNADLDVIDINNYDEALKVIDWIKDNGQKYDLLFLDSLSQLQKQLDKEIPETQNRYAKWNEIKEKTKYMVDQLKRLPFHFVSTCEISKDKDEETGTIMYIPSLLGSSKNDIAYWYDEVYFFSRVQQTLKDPVQYFCLTQAAMKYPCKSRLDLPPQIENPRLDNILSKAGFSEIDKSLQAKDLEKVKEEDLKKEEVVVDKRNISGGIFSETTKDLKDEIMALLNKKNVNHEDFLKHFGANSMVDFPKNRMEEAVTLLKMSEDKEES